MRKKESIRDRIERCIERIPESGCWIWMGALTNNGYGRAKRNGKTVVAHRVVHEALAGNIDEGMTLDHLCRVRCCVNPAHMEVVTPRVNVLRGETVTAKNAAKTHCKRGHPLEGDNLFVRKDGRRRCRACERASQKRFKSKPEQKAKHAAYERAKRKELKMKQPQFKQARQGDVFVERLDISEVPKGATEVPFDGRVILAYGEMTGHCHAIYPTAGGIVPAKLWDAGAERFLQVMEATTLQHEEHGPIALEAGVYRVSKFGIGTQREYSPEEIRTVAD